MKHSADRAAFSVRARAIAFDLDGTLLETGADLAAAANAMLNRLGLEPLAAAQLIDFIGHGVQRLVERALAARLGREAEAALVERGSALFREHYTANLHRHTKPYPGVLESLVELRGRGLKLACITNKPQQFTLPLLERSGLHRHLELIIAGDTLAAKKPDPLPLTHTAREFAIETRELMLVGDSATDVQAARAAGSPVLVVSYGYSAGVPVASLGADAIIDSLAEIGDFLHN